MARRCNAQRPRPEYEADEELPDYHDDAVCELLNAAYHPDVYDAALERLVFVTSITKTIVSSQLSSSITCQSLASSITTPAHIRRQRTSKLLKLHASSAPPKPSVLNQPDSPQLAPSKPLPPTPPVAARRKKAKKPRATKLPSPTRKSTLPQSSVKPAPKHVEASSSTNTTTISQSTKSPKPGGPPVSIVPAAITKITTPIAFRIPIPADKPIFRPRRLREQRSIVFDRVQDIESALSSQHSSLTSLASSKSSSSLRQSPKLAVLR